MSKTLSASDFRFFETLFHPRSIAVAGVSENVRRPGGAFFQNLIDCGYKGKLYPVNIKGGSFGKLEIFRHVTDIPCPVDLVIVSIPRDGVRELMRDCAAKRVKSVQIFSAGFGELGDKEGKQLEQDILVEAKKGGVRIVGPSSIGIGCPASGMPLAPEGFLGEPGDVAFLCQSGSISLELVQVCTRRGIGLSKAVGTGNSIDLDTTDFLPYLAADDKTKAIALYLEGSRESPLLFRLIEDISKEKPVLLWKGGRSEAGQRVVSSHTASQPSPSPRWKALARSSGAVWVESLYEMTDTLLAFKKVGSFRGEDVAVVSGLANGGGGTGIAAVDTLVAAGLSVPRFSGVVRGELQSLLGRVGSILDNPLDVSQAVRNPDKIEKAMMLAAGEPNIGLILLHENLYTLLRWLDREQLLAMNRRFIEVSRRLKKPLVVILPREMVESQSLELEQELCRNGIAVFPSAERAAKALANVAGYYKRRSRYTLT